YVHVTGVPTCVLPIISTGLSNHDGRSWDKSVSHKVKCEQYRYGNILRFPRAAGELPRAIALRNLTDASSPAGVFVYFLRWFSKLDRKSTRLNSSHVSI